MSTSSERYQVQQKFWLNANNPEERELAEWCDHLRENRRFAPTIRQGLMLMRALQQGDTSKLFAIFPQLYDTLYAQMEAEVLEQNTNYHIERLEKLVSRLVIPQGNSALLENTESHETQSIAQNTAEEGGLKPLITPTIAPPIFEDDDEDDLELVVTKASTSNSSSQNFLNAMLSLARS